MSDFEKELKEMFEQAVFSPSERVWGGVESALKGKKKKGIFFYWQTYGVAAGLALLVSLGYLFLKPENSIDNSESKELTQNETKENSKSANSSENSEIEESQTTEESTSSNQELEKTASNIDVNNQQMAALNNVTTTEFGKTSNSKGLAESASQSMFFENNSNEALIAQNNADDLQRIFELRNPDESINIIRARWEMKHMVAALESTEIIKESVVNPSSSGGIVLAGGIGGGSFNPNPNSGSSGAEFADVRQMNFSPSSFASVDIARNSEDKPLGSISAGLGLAYDLDKKWRLNAGLRYSEYKFANEANFYSIEDGVSLPVYLPAGYSGDLVYTSFYNLTNTIRSISLPLQASYELFHVGAFNVRLNGGLVADYYLSYQVKGDLNFLEVRKADFSEMDLFNRFNLGTTGGLSLGYKFNSQWGVALDANYRKYFRANNGDGVVKSKASILGFGVGVNYFIKKEDE